MRQSKFCEHVIFVASAVAGVAGGLGVAAIVESALGEEDKKFTCLFRNNWFNIAKFFNYFLVIL